MKSLMAQLRNTIQEKKMIQDGDRVAVGLSGGKDSMALLFALHQFQKFKVIDFDLCAISIHPGFDNHCSNGMKAFCDNYEIPFYEEKTQIYQIVFGIRNEKNPCALCAKMRRGALVNALSNLKFNVLALGHHNDDAIATLFMNMLNTGRMKTMEFSIHLPEKNTSIIRPMLEIPESQIIGFVKKNEIPITKSLCPMDKSTNRDSTSDLLKQIYKTTPGARASINRAMKNKDQISLWFEQEISL